MTPLQIHAPTLAETVALLEQAGIPRAAIPTELGGAYDHDAKVAEWVACRLRMESSCLKKPPPQPAAVATTTTATTTSSSSSQWVASSSQPGETVPVPLVSQTIEPNHPTYASTAPLHVLPPQAMARQKAPPLHEASSSSRLQTAMVAADGPMERWPTPPPHLIAETRQGTQIGHTRRIESRTEYLSQHPCFVFRCHSNRSARQV